MATTNPFDLLGDDDTEDLTQLIAAQQKLAPAVQPKKPQAPIAQPPKPANLPSKPLPPSQAGEQCFSFIRSMFFRYWVEED